MKKGFLIIAAVSFAVSLWSLQYPFQNPNLSSEERAKDLIPYIDNTFRTRTI